MAATIHYQLDERGVATVTLRRPAVHNAFDDSMIEAMINALAEIEEEPTARILVLQGEGKSFSAGADLAWMKRMADYDFDTNLSDAGRMADMYNALYQLSLPTIALVNGAAYGGGVGLVAACDFAIGGPQAQFCLSEVALGLVPAVISPFVVETIGVKAFKRFSMSGQRFSADEALRLGLLSYLVDEAALAQAVDAMIAQLLHNGPAAMTATKRLATDVALQPIGVESKRHTSHLIASLRGSEEGREGIQAFLHKRPAAWRKEAQ